jgi:hypothetical protein
VFAREILETTSTEVEQLAAITRFLIGRADDEMAEKKISVDVLISLANDFGLPINKRQLRDLSQKPPMDSFIQKITNDEIFFTGATQDMDDNMDIDKARDTVKKMAKRAAK